MCNCVGIESGSRESYQNQVVLEVPEGLELRYNAPGQELKTTVCVDPCLVQEIKWLWSLGIRTTGCCCGHNKLPPYIGVVHDDENRMLDLSYEVQPNEMDPTRTDSFKPRFL